MYATDFHKLPFISKCGHKIEININFLSPINGTNGEKIHVWKPFFFFKLLLAENDKSFLCGHMYV